MLQIFLFSHREVKKGLGIFQFNDDTEAIKSTVFPDSLRVSSVEPHSVVIVVSYSHLFLFVSRNYGKDWDRYTLPTMDFDPVGSLFLSERDPQHMVIHSRGGDVSPPSLYTPSLSHSSSLFLSVLFQAKFV